MTLPEKYKIQDVEETQLSFWAEENIYSWKNADSYTIDTPPPTISGNLHIGHIFSYCHTDFIARYQRMKGKNVFYPMGFDDNGLPTERLVEKKFKIKAKNYDNKDFIKKCHEISAESRKNFKDLFNKIGLSVDWKLEYNTNSNTCHKISQMSFIDLYNKGHIYSKYVPVLWDSIDQTAISQAEVEEKKLNSTMNYINFSVDTEKFIIATTRPELLPACVTLLYNPKDERYNKKLLNKIAKVPLFDFNVPIIPDEDVLIEKGSGLVMCCTYGDDQDIIWKERHNLSEKIIINKYGKIYNLNLYIAENNIYKNKIEGLSIKNARNEIISILKAHGDLIKEENIEHHVRCAERSGAILELIPTKQWYIKILKYKEELLQYGRKCEWAPKEIYKRYEQWVKGLKSDWCISRQRFLGVPIPAWEDKKTSEIIIANINDLPINPRVDIPEGYNKNDIMPIEDVLDTWATSSLTPQINSLGINNKLCEKNNRLNHTLPADLRPQAHEIIRTWAFYTITKSLLHNKEIPWQKIMISGWCLSNNKEKMSKSKNNIIEPLNLINQFGADAIRYWSATANLGTDTVFSEEIIKIGKRLNNKIFNAAKFVSRFELIFNTNLSNVTNIIDEWIIIKFKHTTEEFESLMDELDYCNAKIVAEKFFWKDFCDNYIELVKARLYNSIENPLGKENISVINTINYIIIGILKLFAPFIPFITDYIYRNLYNKGSIHECGNWVKLDKIVTGDTKLGDTIIEILTKTREWKSMKKISIKTPIKSLIITTNYMEEIKKVEFDLINACNVEKIQYKNGEFDPKKILIEE